MCTGQENVHRYRLFTAAMACFVESLASGVVMTFTGTLLPQLTSEGATISTNEESWLASSAILGMAFGSLIGGVIMPHWQRRHLLIATNLLMTTSFLLFYFAHALPVYLIARSLGGLATGISRPIIVSYSAEVAPPHLRPVFTNVILMGHVCGALLSDTIATFATWRWNAAATAIYPLIAAAMLLYLREPYGSYISQLENCSRDMAVYVDGVEALEKSFVWYRGSDEHVMAEVEQVVAACQERAKRVDFSYEYLDRSFLRAFGVCAVFFAAGQLNGVNVLSLYSVQIFKRIFSQLNGNYITIGYDCIKIITSIIGLFVIRRFPVRKLTMASVIGVVTTLTSLAILYYLENEVRIGFPGTYYNVLLSCIIVVYVQSLLIGLAPLPWGAPPELFDPRVRPLGSGATIFLNYVIFFLVVQFTPELLEISYSLTFGLFALITFLLGVILYFVLPETKNKTLVEAHASLK